MEINEAKIKLLNSVSKLELDEEEVSITDAIGKISAEDVVAKVNVPSFPKSAMDGYAVCSRDTQGASKDNPVKLTVIEKLFAGETSKAVFENNSAVRVMTGSLIPEGYDAVVM
ncbi:MAG: molybdopterin molybdenumtransferase MoeA, partial [Eubacterium sp.]|nr:molybdopterin molybdenumtransferase MoeA [Eubacterium sp.]